MSAFAHPPRQIGTLPRAFACSTLTAEEINLEWFMENIACHPDLFIHHQTLESLHPAFAASCAHHPFG